MGLLLWWRGPQGHIYFEELRSASTSSDGLGSISLRQRHLDDWQEIRCVLWLITDDNEYVAQPDIAGRQTEEQSPPSEGPASRLSTIVEKPVIRQRTPCSFMMNQTGRWWT